MAKESFEFHITVATQRALFNVFWAHIEYKLSLSLSQVVLLPMTCTEGREQSAAFPPPSTKTRPFAHTELMVVVYFQARGSRLKSATRPALLQGYMVFMCVL